MLGTFRLLQSEILNLTGITHIWKHIPPINLFSDQFVPVLHPRFFCVITEATKLLLLKLTEKLFNSLKHVVFKGVCLLGPRPKQQWPSALTPAGS